MATKKPARQKIDPIPEFKNYAEEAAFWETHDLADYWDQFTPVKIRFAKNLSQGMTIRLDLDTTVKLKSEAAKKGIGPTTLVRMWVLERLQAQEGARVSNPAKSSSPRKRSAPSL